MAYAINIIAASPRICCRRGCFYAGFSSGDQGKACAWASPAQAAGLTVQTLDIQGKNARGEAFAKGQMTMPLVKAADEASAKVAKKINARLSFMDTQGHESQKFTVSRHDERILTIAFDNEFHFQINMRLGAKTQTVL